MPLENTYSSLLYIFSVSLSLSFVLFCIEPWAQPITVSCIKTLCVYMLSCTLSSLLREKVSQSLHFVYIICFFFSGAVGSTVLAYILPCVFHLKLHWHHLPLLVKVKDIVIILIGLLCGIAGIYSVLLDIIRNESTWSLVFSVLPNIKIESAWRFWLVLADTSKQAFCSINLYHIIR